ncbi:DUF2922 domain-containing protein [Candidatus Enterococcus murrayae]|uniref:DUF2922 domain-containing protein n=1 Tax=Candidatus Enterococcus murrayae TaxID=2815321 RepID=A0ABS3HDZ0_9ENTE|nr:DUF2922 domain-containing protein [Enterococcus sp. MJM16]MBO0451217.1 DUF2922 domain-containing protein [Enterococcus sp. MJM16]
MTHDLVTTFTNGLGKEHDWTYKNVNADLPVEQIKEACELLTQLDIFEKNGVKLFDTVVTAKFVTTYETDIFDVENDPQPVAEKKAGEQHEKTENEATVDTPLEPTSLMENSLQFGKQHTIDSKRRSDTLPLSVAAASKLPKTPSLSPHIGSNNRECFKDLKTNMPENGPKRSSTFIGKAAPLPKAQQAQKEKGKHKGLFARIWGKHGKNKEGPS